MLTYSAAIYYVLIPAGLQPVPDGSVSALQQEDKHAKRALARLAPDNNSAQGAAATQPAAPEVLLFDLVGASKLAPHHLPRHASKRRKHSHHAALPTSLPATQSCSKGPSPLQSKHPYKPLL